MSPSWRSLRTISLEYLLSPICLRISLSVRLVGPRISNMSSRLMVPERSGLCITDHFEQKNGGGTKPRCNGLLLCDCNSWFRARWQSRFNYSWNAMKMWFRRHGIERTREHFNIQHWHGIKFERRHGRHDPTGKIFKQKRSVSGWITAQIERNVCRAAKTWLRGECVLLRERTCIEVKMTEWVGKLWSL